MRPSLDSYVIKSLSQTESCKGMPSSASSTPSRITSSTTRGIRMVLPSINASETRSIDQQMVGATTICCAGFFLLLFRAIIRYPYACFVGAMRCIARRRLRSSRNRLLYRKHCSRYPNMPCHLMLGEFLARHKEIYRASPVIGRCRIIRDVTLVHQGRALCQPRSF